MAEPRQQGPDDRSPQWRSRFDRWETRNPFESRTQVWREVGLGAQVDRVEAKRARGTVVVLLVLIAAVLFVFNQRQSLFPGQGTAVRIVTVILLAALGWSLAGQLFRGLAPALFRRLDPGVAGTVGFLVRLLTVALTVIVALRIAGLDPKALAVGGAFTAIVLGLAAQQTLANLFAGLVLLSTRPFRVGERVRLQGGALAGQLEGTVGSLGLFYTTFVTGPDRTMVPNNIVLQMAVNPLSDPDRVDLRARFDSTVTPAELQRMLDDAITVPVRHSPDITLEELDKDDVIVRISATPANRSDGAQLAGEVLEAITAEGHGTAEHETGGNGRR